MPRLLLSTVLLLLFSSSGFSEVDTVYTDTIVTTGRDSMAVKITLVNNTNIFYAYRRKKSEKSTHILLSEVHQYIWKGELFEPAKIRHEQSKVSQEVSSLEEGVILNNKFIFKDGLYLKHSDFVANKPTYNLKELVLSSLPKNPNESPVSIKSISVKDTSNALVKLKPKEIWGICVDGNPYINVLFIGLISGGEYELFFSQGANFVKIGLIGPICHLYLETKSSFTNDPNTAIPIAPGVYLDPLAGMRYSNQKIFKFKTGEVLDFKYNNLITLLEDDRSLHSEFSEEKKKKAPLLGYVLKYNERNPIYLKE